MAQPRAWFVDAAESAVEGSLVGLCQSQASPPLKLLRPFPEVKVAVRGNLDPSRSDGKVVSLVSLYASLYRLGSKPLWF